MQSGIATRMTSKGNWTMYSPFKENITSIVKSRATRVMGLIRGMNFSSYHVRPLVFRPTNLEIIPAMKGIPR